MLVLSYAITCYICQYSCWTNAVCIFADIYLVSSLHGEQTCLLNFYGRKIPLSALIVYLKISWSFLWWWFRILFPGGRKYSIFPTLKLKVYGNKEKQTTKWVLTYYHFSEKGCYRKSTIILVEGDCFSSGQLHYRYLQIKRIPIFYS